ncbi:MAG: nicotinate-nucleotide adenylyltransferase [Syntrophomonadaceae bacterium]
MAKIKKMGIMGGTFDPLHYGHLLAAEWARELCQLDRVAFVPAARPPHKQLDAVLDGQHRFAMVKLGIRGNRYFTASAVELERQGLSYTVETVTAYLEMYPGAEIYFILGMDALLLTSTWKDVDHLAGLCQFIVATRPGYAIDRNAADFMGVPESLWEKIRFITIPGMNISSSGIRARVAEGKTIKYLLPGPVEKYINEHRLYLPHGKKS